MLRIRIRATLCVRISLRMGLRIASLRVPLTQTSRSRYARASTSKFTIMYMSARAYTAMYT